MTHSALSGSSRSFRLCALCCVLLFWAAPVRASDQTLYECVEVIDGDSVLVLAEGLLAPVRLLGIDCPEMDQEWGEAARKFTAEHVLGREVRLEFDNPRRDNYHRNLCYLWYRQDGGWACLNLELVRAGLAVPYRPRSSIRMQPEILEAQEDALNANAGFWDQGGLQRHPREHRRLHRD
ncbi:MAG: thermonuclease family protein [Oceanidesulfovibrio sp.]